MAANGQPDSLAASTIECPGIDPLFRWKSDHYRAASPGPDFQSARGAARCWASSLGQDRDKGARAFMTEAMEGYLESRGMHRSMATQPSDFLGNTETCDHRSVPTNIATALGRAVAALDPLTSAYWLSSTYTLLLTHETRSRLGIYYTPPALSERLLDMISSAGADWRTCRVLDPASHAFSVSPRSRYNCASVSPSSRREVTSTPYS